MSLVLIFLAAAAILQTICLHSLREDMDCLIRSLPVDQLKTFVREYEKGERK